MRIAFSFHGSGQRIYSRIFLRPVYDAAGDWIRGRVIRIYPDLDEQIISIPILSVGMLEFIEIKKISRSWRWRNVPDAPHLIKVAFFVPE
ncbi:hypothetical protein [Laspinema olomoucense]|uniref:hypothetical protein n=1 Tax=Laspinema olomoucense TaxID=3231600 RepID=UPI0021BAE541|nr:hypothetical protein [Laspinema sp. D3d]